MLNGPHSPDTKNGVTRRDFLKIAGLAGLGGLATWGYFLLTGRLPQKSSEKTPLLAGTKETLQKIPPPIVIVDFAPDGDNPNIIQRSPATKQDFLKRILGEKFIDQSNLEKQFKKSPGETQTQFLNRVFPKYPEVAIAYGIYERIGHHGEQVSQIIVDGLRDHNLETQVELVPLQEMFSPGNIKLITDSLGNIGFSIELTAGPVIAALKKYPSQKIVNLSLQMGEIQAFHIQRQEEVQITNRPPEMLDPKNWNIHYVGAVSAVTINGKTYYRDKDGKEVSPWNETTYQKWRAEMYKKYTKVVAVKEPYTEIKGAYQGLRGEKNLLELFKICDAFPDKLFFAAGGNWGDDVRESRQKLADRWPKNLLLTAAASFNGKDFIPTNHVYGMDLYFQDAGASSFSTPLIASSAVLQERRGFDLSATKNILLNTATLSEFSDYDPKTGEAVIGTIALYSGKPFDQ